MNITAYMNSQNHRDGINYNYFYLSRLNLILWMGYSNQFIKIRNG